MIFNWQKTFLNKKVFFIQSDCKIFYHNLKDIIGYVEKKTKKPSKNHKKA